MAPAKKAPAKKAATKRVAKPKKIQLEDRTLYVVSERRFTTWKAHSVHQTYAGARSMADILEATSLLGQYGAKVEKVTLAD